MTDSSDSRNNGATGKTTPPPPAPAPELTAIVLDTPGDVLLGGGDRGVTVVPLNVAPANDAPAPGGPATPPAAPPAEAPAPSSGSGGGATDAEG